MAFLFVKEIFPQKIVENVWLQLQKILKLDAQMKILDSFGTNAVYDSKYIFSSFSAYIYD